MRLARRLGFKTVDVHFGTFDFTLHVIIGPYRNTLQYVRWKLDDPEYSHDDTIKRRGMTFYREGWVPVVWLPRRPRTPREYGTLAHEALHAVRYMLVDWAGMRFNADTDETFCHAIGHVVTTVLERLDSAR